jgi:hypothetical protein
MTTTVAPPSRLEIVVVGSTCAYAVLLAYATTVWDYDVWGGLVIAPILILVTLPLLRRLADRDGLPGLYPLLVTALIVKLAMSIPRWAVAFVLYDGSADAATYNETGRNLAQHYRHLVFPFSEQAGGFGTKVAGTVTGGVYAVIGPSVIGGFLFFSWLGFLGMLLCYRAARIAVPELDGRRYAILLFFLPSMVFWPSSIGKDALICLAIGLVLYGAARSFQRLRFALPPLVAGLVVALLIRPHIAALLAVSFAGGYLIRPTIRRTPLTPLIKVVGVAVVCLAGLWVVSRAAASLGVSTPSSAIKELNRQGELTSQGGSSFQATPIRGPVDLVRATVSVLFRPFPWEASSAQVLIASVEGAFLLALSLVSWRRVAAGLSRGRNSFLVMTFLYLLGFVVAFSQFGNFGILARQRVQALPLLLVLLSMTPLLPRSRRPVRRQPYSLRSSTP